MCGTLFSSGVKNLRAGATFALLDGLLGILAAYPSHTCPKAANSCSILEPLMVCPSLYIICREYLHNAFRA